MFFSSKRCILHNCIGTIAWACKVAMSQLGALMGKGGAKIAEIRTASLAKVSHSQEPRCIPLIYIYLFLLSFSFCLSISLSHAHFESGISLKWPFIYCCRWYNQETLLVPLKDICRLPPPSFASVGA